MRYICMKKLFLLLLTNCENTGASASEGTSTNLDTQLRGRKNPCQGHLVAASK